MRSIFYKGIHRGLEAFIWLAVNQCLFEAIISFSKPLHNVDVLKCLSNRMIFKTESIEHPVRIEPAIQSQLTSRDKLAYH